MNIRQARRTGFLARLPGKYILSLSPLANGLGSPFYKALIMSRLPIAFLALSSLVALTAGCSQNAGPVRYQLSGEVTFAGQPIPNGMITFTPDSTQGNSGPQGVALIKDGKYDTAAPEGKGIGGGPTIIHILGQAPDGRQVLCEFEQKVELPKQDSQHKIEVPATAANRKPESPEV